MAYRSDEEYYLAREAAERLAAARSASALARDIHLALAARHADRAWSIGEGYAPGRER